MEFVRTLRHRLPLDRGEDVVALQQRLRALGHAGVGPPDGLFGRGTERAVIAFQQANRLEADGIVGALTWAKLFAEQDSRRDKLERVLGELKGLHGFRDSTIQWALGEKGLSIDGAEPEGTAGEPKTVRRVWGQFGPAVSDSAARFGVPAELIVATICTESGGNPRAVREEPGYRSDASTPNRVSPGLMQTLISTAEDALGAEELTREWLFDPANSIRAGTAYISSQFKHTHFDPPKVACAYNAGGVYHNDGALNRWRMRQYPIDSGHHANRFVGWFNDVFRVFAEGEDAPSPSFFEALKSG